MVKLQILRSSELLSDMSFPFTFFTAHCVSLTLLAEICHTVHAKHGPVIMALRIILLHYTVLYIVALHYITLKNM